MNKKMPVIFGVYIFLAGIFLSTTWKVFPSGVPELIQLKVANAVDPLTRRVCQDACGKDYGAQLIWKDVPSDAERVHHGCISGINHEYFARCYKSWWTGSFEHSHLFIKPIKDVDLKSYYCVDGSDWPYWDMRMQNAELGRTYENQ